jgi:hypothetical protein
MTNLIILAVLTVGSLSVTALSVVTMARSLRHQAKFENRVAGCINQLVDRTEYLTETFEDGLDCLLEDDAQRDAVATSEVL